MCEIGKINETTRPLEESSPPPTSHWEVLNRQMQGENGFQGNLVTVGTAIAQIQ